MAKEKKEKKSKKVKKSKTSLDRKKKKKKKRTKSELPKECRLDQSDAIEEASQGDEQLQTKTGGKVNTTDDGDRTKSIPIKLSANFPSSDSTTTGGWSWGTAFASASKVQPSETDSDGNFIGLAATISDGGKQGVMDISQLVNDHNTQKVSSNDAMKNNILHSSESKLKRKRSDSSAGSNNDDDNDDLSTNSDLTLEGRMVTISPIDGVGDMSLVLVHKKSGKVYSSGERKQDGHRLVLGKIVKGDVEFDPSAVEEMKRLEEGDTPPLGQDSVKDTTAKGPSFPYPTNPDDHCETGLESYKDILPVLNELCKSFGGDKHSMKIYDPYFCDGSVVKHLSSLGFSSVYNRKEDCYKVWGSNSEPPFDVFLTNPPYSDDHIEKLMNYVTSSSFGSKPWLILMPQWVHKKDYYINATTKHRTNPCNPFYIVPKRRYVYLPPANFREKKDSDTHKKSSPFISMWFCWGGNQKRNGELMNAFQKSGVGGCDLARSKSALRDLRRGGSSKGKKKKSKSSKCLHIDL